MFLDVGWSEIFLIAIVTIVVFGPEEIPKVMMTLGRIVRRLNYVRFALSQQFEDMMKEAGMDDLRKSVNFEENKARSNMFDEAAADEDTEPPVTDIKKVSNDIS